MPYEAKETKTYDQPASTVTRSAAEVINQLGGKTSKKNDPADGRLEANFNKKIKGKVFGNRCDLTVQITSQTPEQCIVSVEAYPVDPIGNKLMFGVRGDPARLVVDTFLADLDERIAG
jgi:hypothetical protein